ncbi:hypothetical protein [Burkholderia sp. Ed8]
MMQSAGWSRLVAKQLGHLGDADIAAVRHAGYDDAPSVEIVALAAVNVFTHDLDEVAKTHIDFPVVADLADRLHVAETR